MKKLIRSLLLSASFTSSIFCADIEEYFKPVQNKTDSHQMKNIDFIYMINLNERPEKFAKCIETLAPYNIHPFRFSAVNGWKLSLEAINDVGVKYAPWMNDGHLGTYFALDRNFQADDEWVHVPGRTYFSHALSRGAIGIALSHLSVLQDAYDSGYETIWVMEDDIEIIRNPHLLSDLIEKLDNLIGKKGWDILFTDRDTKDSNGKYISCSSFAWRPNFTPANPNRFSENKMISPDFRCIGARYGAYSMIVRRSGMKKILDFFKAYQIFLPFDMEYTLPHSIRLFTVIEDVVSTQPQALSDNKLPYYEKQEKGV